MDDACSVTVELKSTELQKLVKLYFRIDPQKCTYRRPSIFSALVTDLDTRAHFTFY